MQRDHLLQELIKLERVKDFLKKTGINYPEDFKLYFI
jgi:hypothetical protein